MWAMRGLLLVTKLRLFGPLLVPHSSFNTQKSYKFGCFLVRFWPKNARTLDHLLRHFGQRRTKKYHLRQPKYHTPNVDQEWTALRPNFNHIFVSAFDVLGYVTTLHCKLQLTEPHRSNSLWCTVRDTHWFVGMQCCVVAEWVLQMCG